MRSSAQYLIYRFESFTLDLGRGALLSAKNTEIPLRPKAFVLLRMLVENAGLLLSRDAIMEALWPNIFVTDDNLTQCISDIRRALNDESSRMLRTVPRRGYIFSSDVTGATRVYPRSENIGINEGVGTATASSDLFAKPDDHASILNPRGGGRRPPRLSVLFALLPNQGGASGEHIQCLEGIAEDIATDLSQYPGSFVVGVVPGGPAISPRDAAQALGVNYLIQGRIRATAAQIGANVQLIDVETGGHLWAQRFDIPCDHCQDSRNEIIGRLVRTLSLRLVEDVNRRIEALPLQDWTPSDLVMRGRALISRTLSQSNRHAALYCFEEALDAEPDLTDAKLGIAFVLVANIADGWSDAIEADKKRAEHLLHDVLRVDAHLPMARFVMGMLRRLQFRLIDSRIELALAIELMPNYAAALAQLGITLSYLGQPEEAIPYIKRSLRLAPHDPATPVSHVALGTCHLLLGHVDEAIVLFRTARAGNPGLFYTHFYLAAALGLKGDLAEAEAALRQGVELQPGLGSTSGLRAAVGQQNDAFMTLFENTVHAGLLRAGLRNE